MEPADVVLRFLESIGRRSEAEFYLALFRAEAKEQFAAIVVDPAVQRYALDAVLVDLRFLAALGLTPVVVTNLRHSDDAPTLTARLERGLSKVGVSSRSFTSHAALADVGAVAETAHLGNLPVVTFEGDERHDPGGRLERLARLLTGLHTRKVIFLRRAGAMRRSGHRVPLVNLTTEYPLLKELGELHEKDRALLRDVYRLVELVPQSPLVSVTSPLNLLRELFTVKGSGTLLRRGTVIERFNGFHDVDLARLRSLLESSFGGKVADGFFDREVTDVYIAENYIGAALVVDTPLGGYLTKFAVDRKAQGEGVGRDLWDRMRNDQTKLFWRARPHNPISAWYVSISDGVVRFPDWHVFWIGIQHDAIADIVRYAMQQPTDIQTG